MDIDQLKLDIEEWLDTLDDDEGYWDGVFCIDKGMARSFLLDGRPYSCDAFFEWIKNKYA